MDVVADQRGVEQNAEPLPSNQEQDVEENVKDVPDFISIIWLLGFTINWGFRVGEALTPAEQEDWGMRTGLWGSCNPFSTRRKQWSVSININQMKTKFLEIEDCFLIFTSSVMQLPVESCAKRLQRHAFEDLWALTWKMAKKMRKASIMRATM